MTRRECLDAAARPIPLAEIRERLLSDPEVRAAYEAMDEEEE